MGHLRLTRDAPHGRLSLPRDKSQREIDYRRPASRNWLVRTSTLILPALADALVAPEQEDREAQLGRIAADMVGDFTMPATPEAEKLSVLARSCTR